MSSISNNMDNNNAILNILVKNLQDDGVICNPLLKTYDEVATDQGGTGDRKAFYKYNDIISKYHIILKSLIGEQRANIYEEIPVIDFYDSENTGFNNRYFKINNILSPSTILPIPKQKEDEDSLSLLLKNDPFTINRVLLGEEMAEHFFNTTSQTPLDFNIQTSPFNKNNITRIYKGIFDPNLIYDKNCFNLRKAKITCLKYISPYNILERNGKKRNIKNKSNYFIFEMDNKYNPINNIGTVDEIRRLGIKINSLNDLRLTNESFLNLKIEYTEQELKEDPDLPEFDYINIVDPLGLDNSKFRVKLDANDIIIYIPESAESVAPSLIILFKYHPGAEEDPLSIPGTKYRVFISYVKFFAFDDDIDEHTDIISVGQDLPNYLFNLNEGRPTKINPDETIISSIIGKYIKISKEYYTYASGLLNGLYSIPKTLGPDIDGVRNIETWEFIDDYKTEMGESIGLSPGTKYFPSHLLNRGYFYEGPLKPTKSDYVDITNTITYNYSEQQHNYEIVKSTPSNLAHPGSYIQIYNNFTNRYDYPNLGEDIYIKEKDSDFFIKVDNNNIYVNSDGYIDKSNLKEGTHVYKVRYGACGKTTLLYDTINNVFSNRGIFNNLVINPNTWQANSDKLGITTVDTLITKLDYSTEVMQKSKLNEISRNISNFNEVENSYNVELVSNMYYPNKISKENFGWKDLENYFDNIIYTEYDGKKINRIQGDTLYIRTGHNPDKAVCGDIDLYERNSKYWYSSNSNRAENDGLIGNSSLFNELDKSFEIHYYNNFYRSGKFWQFFGASSKLKIKDLFNEFKGFYLSPLDAFKLKEGDKQFTDPDKLVGYQMELLTEITNGYIGKTSDNQVIKNLTSKIVNGRREIPTPENILLFPSYPNEFPDQVYLISKKNLFLNERMVPTEDTAGGGGLCSFYTPISEGNPMERLLIFTVEKKWEFPVSDNIKYIKLYDTNIAELDSSDTEFNPTDTAYGTIERFETIEEVTWEDVKHYNVSGGIEIRNEKKVKTTTIDKFSDLNESNAFYAYKLKPLKLSLENSGGKFYDQNNKLYNFGADSHSFNVCPLTYPYTKYFPTDVVENPEPEGPEWINKISERGKKDFNYLKNSIIISELPAWSMDRPLTSFTIGPKFLENNQTVDSRNWTEKIANPYNLNVFSKFIETEMTSHNATLLQNALHTILYDFKLTDGETVNNITNKKIYNPLLLGQLPGVVDSLLDLKSVLEDVSNIDFKVMKRKNPLDLSDNSDNFEMKSLTVDDLKGLYNRISYVDNERRSIENVSFTINLPPNYNDIAPGNTEKNTLNIYLKNVFSKFNNDYLFLKTEKCPYHEEMIRCNLSTLKQLISKIFEKGSYISREDCVLLDKYLGQNTGAPIRFGDSFFNLANSNDFNTLPNRIIDSLSEIIENVDKIYKENLSAQSLKEHAALANKIEEIKKKNSAEIDALYEEEMSVYNTIDSIFKEGPKLIKQQFLTHTSPVTNNGVTEYFKEDEYYVPFVKLKNNISNNYKYYDTNKILFSEAFFKLTILKLGRLPKSQKEIPSPNNYDDAFYLRLINDDNYIKNLESTDSEFWNLYKRHYINSLNKCRKYIINTKNSFKNNFWGQFENISYDSFITKFYVTNPGYVLWDHSPLYYKENDNKEIVRKKDSEINLIKNTFYYRLASFVDKLNNIITEDISDQIVDIKNQYEKWKANPKAKPTKDSSLKNYLKKYLENQSSIFPSDEKLSLKETLEEFNKLPEYDLLVEKEIHNYVIKNLNIQVNKEINRDEDDHNTDIINANVSFKLPYPKYKEDENGINYNFIVPCISEIDPNLNEIEKQNIMAESFLEFSTDEMTLKEPDVEESTLYGLVDFIKTSLEGTNTTNKKNNKYVEYTWKDRIIKGRSNSLYYKRYQILNNRLNKINGPLGQFSLIKYGIENSNISLSSNLSDSYSGSLRVTPIQKSGNIHYMKANAISNLDPSIVFTGKYYRPEELAALKEITGQQCILTCTSCPVADSCKYYDKDTIIKTNCSSVDKIDLWFKDNKLDLLSYSTEKDEEYYGELSKNYENLLEDKEYVLDEINTIKNDLSTMENQLKDDPNNNDLKQNINQLNNNLLINQKNYDSLIEELNSLDKEIEAEGQNSISPYFVYQNDDYKKVIPRESFKKVHNVYSNIMIKEDESNNVVKSYTINPIEDYVEGGILKPGLRTKLKNAGIDFDEIGDGLGRLIGARYGTIEYNDLRLLFENENNKDYHFKHYKCLYDSLYIPDEETEFNYRPSKYKYNASIDLYNEKGEKEVYKGSTKIQIPTSLKALENSLPNDKVYLVSDDKFPGEYPIEPVIYLGTVDNVKKLCSFDLGEDKNLVDEGVGYPGTSYSYYPADVAQWCVNYVKGPLINHPLNLPQGTTSSGISLDTDSNKDQFWMPKLRKLVKRKMINSPNDASTTSEVDTWITIDGRPRVPANLHEQPLMDPDNMNTEDIVSGKPLVANYYNFIRRMSIKIWDEKKEDWTIPWVDSSILYNSIKESNIPKENKEENNISKNIEVIKECKRQFLPLMKTNLRLVIITPPGEN